MIHIGILGYRRGDKTARHGGKTARYGGKTARHGGETARHGTGCALKRPRKSSNMDRFHDLRKTVEVITQPLNTF